MSPQERWHKTQSQLFVQYPQFEMFRIFPGVLDKNKIKEVFT